MPTAARYFGLIPAAGRGERIGGSLPKQYVALGGKTMLEHAIDALAREARIARIVVVVAPEDRRWQALPKQERVRFVAQGGASRAQSVRNGLQAIEAAPRDWILVHDAARPCLSADELTRLLDMVDDDDVGGLLALPVADTLKRSDGERVIATVERADLWRALTPQMFRADVLGRALAQDRDLAAVTDEASAVEALGLQPRLVPGASANIKVTLGEDWPLAIAVLRAQGRIE